MSPRDPAPLVLAVQDPALHERLTSLLRQEDVQVRLVPDLQDRDPGDLDADLVVLRSSRLEPEGEHPILDAADRADAPGVVVIGEGDAPLEEVRLVAAGASAVLDPGQSRQDLADQLVELVEAESEGGLDGPEAGGSVAEPRLADFQSRSPRMRDFVDMVRKVASSDSTLLLTGETGVGKERLARAVHAESPRSGGPFVAVNCGALSENLLESELFGHEKGAFTGADDARPGHFRTADGGTLFLDEVGEMPPHLQVKLLTVLQRREVQPLGASEPVRVDVRVLAATNRDLADDVREGRFREDLLFRLNVVSLTIPPLRERLEDLPWFVGRFLRHFAENHERPDVQGVTRGALDALLAHDWPGNIRELVNVVERAVLLCEGDRLRRADLPESVVHADAPSAPTSGARSDDLDPAWLELPMQEARRRVVEGFERRYLEHLLTATHGQVGEVASRAGINPRTLYEKMRRLGLRKEDYRPARSGDA